jgi:predicted GNAT family acetyltransferase
VVGAADDPLNRRPVDPTTHLTTRIHDDSRGPTTMTTTVTDDRDRRRYEITEDGEPVGFVSYRLGTGVIDLIHTEIDPDHSGRGLAGVLIRTVLDDARARGLTVVPHCPYVAKFIGEHADEYLDLVAEDRRRQFGLAG